MTDYIVLDIATAPLENAADFLDEEFAAPANYKDPAKIAAYIADAKADAKGACGLDPDLCRITGIAMSAWDGTIIPYTYESDGQDQFEAQALLDVQRRLNQNARFISYNGLRFDWPVLNARARYLGVKLNINLDRFKSPHVDLYAKLTNHGQLKGHSLSWWVKRHGWTDLTKPLEGKEESRVFETGKWQELADSLRHDVEATRRLAVWAGVLPSAPMSYAAVADAAELF
jgi:predicted PolB exonuclease-like 3'-5' exonuclease